MRRNAVTLLDRTAAAALVDPLILIFSREAQPDADHTLSITVAIAFIWIVVEQRIPREVFSASSTFSDAPKGDIV